MEDSAITIQEITTTNLHETLAHLAKGFNNSEVHVSRAHPLFKEIRFWNQFFKSGNSIGIRKTGELSYDIICADNPSDLSSYNNLIITAFTARSLFESYDSGEYSRELLDQIYGIAKQFVRDLKRQQAKARL